MEYFFIVLIIILITGDLVDEDEVLEWLTDPDNLELTDHIEEVNAKMFQRVIQRSDHVALILCELHEITIQVSH